MFWNFWASISLLPILTHSLSLLSLSQSLSPTLSLSLSLYRPVYPSQYLPIPLTLSSPLLSPSCYWQLPCTTILHACSSVNPHSEEGTAPSESVKTMSYSHYIPHKNIVDLIKIGHLNINTGIILLLKTIINLLKSNWSLYYGGIPFLWGV